MKATVRIQMANYSFVVITRSRTTNIVVTVGWSWAMSCVACVVGLSVPDEASSAVVQLPTRTVAVSGQSAPGVEGASFSDFSSPALSNAGQTAFGATLVVGGDLGRTNDTGTWSEGSGVLSLVAREGFPAPGTAGAKFSDFAPTSFEFNSLPAINDAGQTMFRRFLQTNGDINENNDVGLWAEDRFGILTKVVRDGDLLEVAEGDFRTISSIGFVSNSGNEDGRRSGFNDLGQVAFWARFTDRTAGIFVTDVITRSPSDLDGDGDSDTDDIDSLVREISSGMNTESFDLNGDGMVDVTDLARWLSDAASQNEFREAYLFGDANLDGSVNSVDLNRLALHWQTDGALWSGGDFTADGSVDPADLNKLALNWQQSIASASSAGAPVPEPSAWLLTIVGLVLVWRPQRCS